jgi:hypothetical protein
VTYDHTQVGRNPQTEYETEQFAEELERAARSLSRAVGQPSGLASPATVYAVLDAVHAATSGLDSLLSPTPTFSRAPACSRTPYP